MHLEIHYIYILIKINISTKIKMSYNLEKKVYFLKQKMYQLATIVKTIFF
jgi:hypothetical protein